MSINVSRIFIILSVLILASCSETLDIQLDPEVTVFLSKDSEKAIRLTPKDKEYTVLNEWLNESRSDWNSTSGRYPSGVFVQSGSYGIQVTKRHVILYDTNHPDPKAIYIQKIGKDELSVIKNIGLSH